ncbi:hypothetical protein F4810DRAFT_725461 [Camillea tinctor]|nr:hypothetical protein F4810DRAFT_725461 [Camillea tinctor]
MIISIPERIYSIAIDEGPVNNPNELPLGIKSTAPNPIDAHLRNHGYALDVYPTVFGTNVSGIVLQVRPSVSSSLGPRPHVSALPLTMLPFKSALLITADDPSHLLGYNASSVEKMVVRAAREDKPILSQHSYDAVSAPQSCRNIIKARNGDSSANSAAAVIPRKDIEPPNE